MKRALIIKYMDCVKLNDKRKYKTITFKIAFIATFLSFINSSFLIR